MQTDSRVVLNVGCGPKGRAHGFAGLSDWREVRMDIDPAVQPDVLGTMTDMATVATGSVDAIVSSKPDDPAPVFRALVWFIGLGATFALARQIASKSPLTLAIGKEAFYRQVEMDLGEAYRYASEVMTRNMLARDAEIGIDALLAKTSPQWCGR